MKKLDPRLRHLMRQRTAEAPELSERVGFRRVAERPDTVEVLVRCAGDAALDQLRAEGMQVRFTAQGAYTVASGEASLDTLEKLGELSLVARVEASRPMLAELDRSRIETRAAALHTATTPLRGAGMIVGVVDGGIDFTHPDFRHADGSSRILFLWDQAGASVPDSTVPYGREYTKADLDTALKASDPFALVPHRDVGAHGTHVAGIAAGNGRAGAGQFSGVAPDVDLIVVAVEPEAGRTLGRSVRAFEAVTYIVQRSNGHPVAINLSQGMNGGGHSGETVLETGLDNLVRQPGVVVVKSAGNEQEWRIHAGGEVAQGQTVSVEFLVETNDREDDVFEVWYEGADQISLTVQPPGGSPLDFVAPGSAQEFETVAHNRVSVDFDLDADDTGDTLATVILSRGHAPFIQPGPWRLLLRGDTVQVGRYDVWIERTFRNGAGIEQSRFSAASADDTRTISIPGTARRIITVGSYVTRPEPGFSPPPGQISSFSSRGPTRYGLQKPEIAAPGEVIISARSSQSHVLPNPDQQHTAMPGTSMAAPHVTGAVALMLSVRPDLTCEQVKQILMRTARRDGFAFSAPDNIWGNGKLDVEAAVEGARTARFPQIRNVQVNGTSLSWQTDIPTTAAVRFHTHQRQLQLGKSLGSRADLTLQTGHRIALNGLDPGTYYCEILAFSEDNWWTADDKGGLMYVVNVPLPIATPAPAGGGIVPMGDFVLVGGVRVPVRHPLHRL